MVDKLKKIPKQKAFRKSIIYSLIALLIFASLFAVTYSDRKGRQESRTVKYVMMGDSVLGQFRDETSVGYLLSEALGEFVSNAALGGTTMGRVDREMRLANTLDCLSMQSLARAIVTGDFGVQQTVRVRGNGTEYFEGVINDLERIDFESVDILFIQHGINDYHDGIPIYNDEDSHDVYTFTGALRSSVEMLKKAYPEMRIILLTPTYSWYLNQYPAEITCENYNPGGGILEHYVEAELSLAAELEVEIIDLYHNFYPHEQWNDWQLYTVDGVHPNEAGRQLIAEKIYAYLSGTKISDAAKVAD